jgi:hypothetical protein
MRNVNIVLCVVGVVLSLGAFAVAQSSGVVPSGLQAPLNLSEVDRLRAENFRLKTALAEQQFNEARRVLLELERERVKLEAEFVKTLGGKDGDAFDWATNALKVKPKTGGTPE